MDELQSFQSQIDALQKKLNNLYSSSTIDRNVETALTERLSSSFFAQPTGTSTAPTQSIGIAAVPTNITVPAQPSGTLTVTYNGTTYNLLYK